LPFDYAVYGRDLVAYLDEVEKLANERSLVLDFGHARAAARALAAIATPSTDVPAERRAGVNRGLMDAERALLSPEGIPGRPWFRHLVYAPLPTYQAETLPGVREAVMAGDGHQARAQLGVLAAALRRARAALVDGAR